ncbi:putative ribonuclease H-like domain-containing protein [Tanacetum coccineum]
MNQLGDPEAQILAKFKLGFNCGKPLYSRFTKTNDFKGVPHPLSGDYTPKPQEEIDDSLYVYGKKGPQKPEISVSDDNSSEHSTCQSNDSEGSCGNTSEHSFETESESLSVPNEMSKSRLEITNEKVVSELQEVEPSCAKHVKTPRQPLKDKETHKVNRKNWNDMMERELGEGYSFTKKKCFVCGSLSHLIKDCDYYEKKMAREAEVKRVVNTGNWMEKPVWTKANRVNHSNKFVPRSVQLNAGRPKFNSVRPNINTGRTNINSVRPKVNAVSSNINTVRSRQPVPNKTSNSLSPKRPQMNQINQRRDFSKSYSSVRRPFAKTTAQMSHAVMGNWESAVKTSASYNWRNSRPNFNYNSGPTFIRTEHPLKNMVDRGIFDSGCSGHMTGNKDQLEDFEEFNGGSVTFGGSKGYISGKGRIRVGNLDFDSVSFVKELGHFNLFSISQICDKQHKVSLLASKDSKDETSGILQTFIRQIENQLSHRVKIIRSDNGTEFKNRDMLEFCGNKGIKQEYSTARTPQQNGVAERMNRTLIEAARTMLADSLLPTTFWAEAVSTACYIFNRVRVTKPQNKTPYELLFGHKPIISYIRPFGCHVTILDTLSVLGKFDGKSDEGFLVGYSLNSKAYRVYNLVTKRVEVNLHVNFLEDKPNVKGVGYRWMFDIDYLSDSMNYIPVSLENQANPHAGISEKTNNAGTSQTPKSNASEEKDEDVELIVVPSTVRNTEGKAESRKSSTNSKKEEILTELQQEKKDLSTDTSEDNSKIQAFRRELEDIALKHLGKVSENTTTSTTSVNTGSEPVNTGRLDHDDSSMPELEIFHKSETGIFDEASYDEDGVITDFNSLPTEIEVSPTPTLRIHSIHPKSQILGDPKSAVQTRSKVQNKSGAHALLSHIQKQQRNNHKDQQHCLFACFLSQEEPKKIAEALQDDSWVQAMQEELLQFKLQQVWVLVDLPHGMKVIGTKWVYRNKRDERGEGIDYDVVFALVARIEAIRKDLRLVELKLISGCCGGGGLVCGGGDVGGLGDEWGVDVSCAGVGGCGTIGSGLVLVLPFRRGIRVVVVWGGWVGRGVGFMVMLGCCAEFLWRGGHGVGGGLWGVHSVFLGYGSTGVEGLDEARGCSVGVVVWFLDRYLGCGGFGALLCGWRGGLMGGRGVVSMGGAVGCGAVGWESGFGRGGGAGVREDQVVVCGMVGLVLVGVGFRLGGCLGAWGVLVGCGVGCSVAGVVEKEGVVCRCVVWVCSVDGGLGGVGEVACGLWCLLLGVGMWGLVGRWGWECRGGERRGRRGAEVLSVWGGWGWVFVSVLVLGNFSLGDEWYGEEGECLEVWEVCLVVAMDVVGGRVSDCIDVRGWGGGCDMGEDVGGVGLGRMSGWRGVGEACGWGRRGCSCGGGGGVGGVGVRGGVMVPGAAGVWCVGLFGRGRGVGFVVCGGRGLVVGDWYAGLNGVCGVCGGLCVEGEFVCCGGCYVWGHVCGGFLGPVGVGGVWSGGEGWREMVRMRRDEVVEVVGCDSWGRKNWDLREESQDVHPLVSWFTRDGLVTPSMTTVNASGEEQVEDISPNTLEAAKTLSRVASLKPKSIDKGRRYKRRKETKGKKDSLLAQRIAEEEELNEQQQKRRAQVQFKAQHYTDEDWDLIRAKIEANAELSKSMLGSHLQGEDFAK